MLLEEGHCLRDHAIVACGPRAAAGAPTVEATSLPTLVQMVEGGLGVTLLPEMTLKAGILKGTRLVARPFAAKLLGAGDRARIGPGGARGHEVALLADLVVEYAAPKLKAGLPSIRRGAPRDAGAAVRSARGQCHSPAHVKDRAPGRL